MHSALVTMLLLLVAACADFEPFEPPMPGEMNPEPGLFTGPTGEFVLHRNVGAKTTEDDAEAAEPPRKLTDPPPP